jgi:hypothetical protein
MVTLAIYTLNFFHPGRLLHDFYVTEKTERQSEDV